MADWRRDLLQMIDAPVTPGNLRLLATWQRWEGGHTNNSARFNWLNTTMDAPGAVGSINGVGVKAFRDRRSGVNALASTILNGRYNDIVSGLRSGRPFTHDLSAGLSTWVSGSPTGNLKYAEKIMGRTGGSRKAPEAPRSRPVAATAPPAAPDRGFDALRIAFSDDPGFVDLLESFHQDGVATERPQPRPDGHGHEEHTEIRQEGPGIRVPRSWQGTHPTDGLGWKGSTAIDIMGKPGTPVILPEAVTVVYYHPTGAQGGGSMLVRTKSGREYWLGHITQAAKPGSTIRAGQALAYISADHPRPHVHVDRRG